MFSKKITWTDWNGEQVTQTFYFHLTKTEMVKLNLKYSGGLVNTLNKLLETNDEQHTLMIVDDIIMTAYGEKSEDGLHFVKANGAKAAAFAETGAYDALFVELVSDPGKLSTFMSEIMPKDLADQARTQMNSNVVQLPQ